MPAANQLVVRGLLGNDSCADCDASSPSWASTTYRISLCPDCAGEHRRLGVHVSFVRTSLLVGS